MFEIFYPDWEPRVRSGYVARTYLGNPTGDILAGALAWWLQAWCAVELVRPWPREVLAQLAATRARLVAAAAGCGVLNGRIVL